MKPRKVFCEQLLAIRKSQLEQQNHYMGMLIDIKHIFTLYS
jgi:hypothetical protein